MGQAWLRMGLIPQARSAFAEGALRWPAEPRFTRALACVYARLGQSREALQTLAGYLSQRPADTDMLALGVEWVFRAHATGGIVSEGELTFARRWTEAYERANGPRAVEVRRWLQMLETSATGTPPPNPI